MARTFRRTDEHEPRPLDERPPDALIAGRRPGVGRGGALPLFRHPALRQDDRFCAAEAAPQALSQLRVHSHMGRERFARPVERLPVRRR